MRNCTPGPWSWEYHPDTQKPIAITSGEDDVLLATGDYRRSWVDVSKANARLIATAPELLNACRIARLRLLSIRDAKGIDSQGTIDFLADAIAKAEGRS